MKHRRAPVAGSALLTSGLALALGLVAAPVRACTIFVLTDASRALFCNNEDWSDPNTRIWFEPAATNHFGSAYVGFDNGWAQGGLNTEGLAFDWVAGYDDTWHPDPALPKVFGNSSVQMLDTCATVGQAIAFYRGHQESEFHRARILVADRTGASVIIGAKDNQLLVEQSGECRGFGYGQRTLDKMLAESREPTVAHGAKILRACAQKGQYATKYSNIYDLKSGDIFLYPFPGRDDEVKLNLAAELEKGGHYYDMHQIHEQLTQPPRPLLANMQPFLLEKYKPLPDQEPALTAHVRDMLQQLIDGSLHKDDYTDKMWNELTPQLKDNQDAVKSFGRLVSMTLVDRNEEDGQRSYRYRLEFENKTLLQHVVFDDQKRLAFSQTEDIR